MSASGREVALLPGGEDMPITWENRHEYVRLGTSQRDGSSVRGVRRGPPARSLALVLNRRVFSRWATGMSGARALCAPPALAYRLHEFDNQIAAMQEGLYDVMPAHVVSLLTWEVQSSQPPARPASLPRRGG